MSSYSLSNQWGTIRPGQFDSIWTPNPRRASTKYPCILVHGSGAPQEFTYLTNFGSVPLAANIALAGIPTMASENDGQAWGNDQSLTDIDLQVTALATRFGTPAGKCVLVGGSMGGYTALRYAILNPTKVAAVVGLIPLTDMVYFYNYTYTGTAQAEVASAWGVTAPRVFADMATTSGSATVTSATAAFTTGDNGKVLSGPNVPVGATITYVSATQVSISANATATASGQTGKVLTALPAAADIQSNAASLTVPTRIYYSANDAIVFPSKQTAFAAAANSGAGVVATNVGTNGHSEQTLLDALNYNGTRGADIISFLKSNGA